ncbi:heavy-metal-associated domain-containing protein [Candidatus Gracilibacteria bacterium]|nr:heavy-metal-associated domain-containing protein [Candidatus Gracilibacteria bacterium]
MQKIQVINIKCSGCKNTITKELETLGANSISIDIGTGIIQFEYEGKIDLIIQKLLSLGYPETGSKEALSLLKKAKSYISCALGKIS